MTQLPKVLTKPLSANDLGLTGSHQAGILVPKEVSTFFAELNDNERNPRIIIKVIDCNGKIWFFNFIYYNNKLFGGTRNEYRLTGMTKFIREHALNEGDRIEFVFDSNSNLYTVNFYKNKMEREKPLAIKGRTRIITIKNWEMEI